MILLHIPIAWLQLSFQKVRFLATLAGVTFVTVLLFMQLGFQGALYRSAVRLHERLIGDVFLVSPQYTSITAQQSFSRMRLYQAMGLDEVESVTPLYFQFAKLKNIETGEKNSIFVFGVDPAQPVFKDLGEELDILKQPNSALFDRASRREFGPIAQVFERTNDLEIEVSPYNDVTFARRLEVRGLFTQGPSFGVDGNLIINYTTFPDIFLERNAEKIDVGAIRLKPGADTQAVIAKLTKRLPDDVKIFSRETFIATEKNYWATRTPIGFTFTLMVTMGFVVGVVVVYQILYSNISSNLTEFATLKAIGHTNGYLFSFVFQQALILAVFGFFPGLVISFGLYDISRSATQLPVIMTLPQSLNVLTSIFFMCFVSGILAVGKLRSADPADIF
jgi:putative ABC transport system permease protein